MAHLSVDICRNHRLWFVTQMLYLSTGAGWAGLLAGQACLLIKLFCGGKSVMKSGNGKDGRVRGDSLRQRGRTCRRTGRRARPQEPAGGHRRARSQSSRREAQEGLGLRIRAMRLTKGWTQKVFAEICGIDRNLLGAIERGNQNFGLGTLLAIATKLNTTVAELFTGIA